MQNYKPIAFLVAAAASAFASADVSLSLNTKEGQKLSGVHTFVVTPQSDSLVTSVEFYVNDDLRDTDESTPYSFSLDTLEEAQGSATLTFAVYNEKGESAKQNLKVVFDNGFELGVEKHVEMGSDALSNSNWDAAIQEGRIALKMEPQNAGAKRLMCRAYLGKGVMDQAQKFGEEVLAANPADRSAMDLLSVVHLTKGFRVLATDADRDKTIATIAAAFSKAAELRHESLEAGIEAFGEVTDANRLAYTDALTRAGRYSLAITELGPRFKAGYKDTAMGNRLVYALIRAGRFSEAAQTMKNFERYGSPDGYTFALKAILYMYSGDSSAALDAEKEAILDSPGSLGVRTAQAYLALRRNDNKTLANLITGLVNDQGQDPVVQHNLASLFYRNGQFDESNKATQTALLAEPASYATYIERANQAVAASVAEGDTSDESKYQRAFALALFDAALAAKPDSYEALTGKAVVLLMNGDGPKAVSMGQAAANAGPEYAPGHYVLSAALSATKRYKEASDALKAAEALDTRALQGRPLPNAVTAWRYFWSAGRTPLIAQPSTGG